MKYGDITMKEKKDNYSFCFKKVGGLKLINPNERLVEVYKKKSRSALNMLESAKEKQEDEWILDTSYYAKYFMVYALFMKFGIKSEIHDCTIFALKSLFVEESIIDNDTYEELEKSKDLRVGALYYDKDFGREEILKRAKTAPEFCLKVESILDKVTKEDIENIIKKFNVLKSNLLRQNRWASMKRAFIVHRWDGTSKSDWYPWLKKEVEKKGFKVEVPTMPNTSIPKIDDWVNHLKKVVGKLDSETYFIGHSIGCQTIMRYLEKENYNSKIGGIIFVAGWFKLDNLEGEEVEAIANPWMNITIDFNKIKQKIPKLSVFLSTNEPYGFVEENTKIFKEKLNAKVILEKNKGHFTEDDGINELPEVLKEILGYNLC